MRTGQGPGVPSSVIAAVSTYEDAQQTVSYLRSYGMDAARLEVVGAGLRQATRHRTVPVARLAGVSALNPSLGETARAFGATRLQQILYIALPASLPSVVAALRLGGALVIVGVIVAEMLGASEGLGYLVTRYRTLLNSPGVYAGIILVLAMTGLHEALLRRLDRSVATYRER